MYDPSVSSARLSVERDYPLIWARRRARRTAALKLLIVAVLLLLTGTFAELRHQMWAALAIGFAFPMLFMANLVWVWSLFFRCPRCGHPFGAGKRRAGRSALAGLGPVSGNPFTKQCLSCGLALRAEE
ncbi:hypothetical protein [Paracidobacterium acidisoli]|uniref:Uncharacterized protein n=1 Tax=Paracidobacterium acidisoli TaxID=2303751 RepID=A0A372IKD7_9BACT|nr:hypothetical protein [Paracidobacterium acidisoli]MBT9332712.1 hypothetical protein [Paracidobacterium acidisoli]